MMGEVLKNVILKIVQRYTEERDWLSKAYGPRGFWRCVAPWFVAEMIKIIILIGVKLISAFVSKRKFKISMEEKVHE